LVNILNRTHNVHNVPSVSPSTNLKNTNERAATNARDRGDPVSNINKKESAELNFTLMIIVASLLFTLTRLVQFISVTVDMIYQELGLRPPLIAYLSFASYYSTIVYYVSLSISYIRLN
jgi:hypothetical protein